MQSRLPPMLGSLRNRLSEFGFERTRRALAALGLSLFVSLYLLLALLGGDELARACIALSLCYGVAFIGVVAEWFWARWFATGLAWSGLMIAGASLVMLGWSPVLAVFGGVHGLIVLALMGKKMAVRYDLQEAWRERYKMDEFGVARLQKTVTRAAASLPSLIFWALGPREDGMTLIAGIAAVLFAAAGLRGLVRLRTWGVMALGAAAAIVAAAGDVTKFAFTSTDGDFGAFPSLMQLTGSTLALVLLAAAVLPFSGAIARFLRRPLGGGR
jgi:hypothetical protein